MLNEHAIRERNAGKAIDDGTVMINTFAVDSVQNPSPQFLAASDRDFIQTFCIDVIRLKKQEKVSRAIKVEKAPE